MYPFISWEHRDYSDKLAELCGNKKNPKSMTNIFKFYFNRDPEDLLGYKNNEIKILGDENSELFWWYIKNMNI